MARRSKLVAIAIPALAVCVVSIFLLPASVFASNSAYVVDYNSANIYQFNVNSSTGALTAKSPSSLSANGSTPRSIAVSPDAQNAYVATLWGTSQFSINAVSGALAALSPTYLALGSNKYGVAVSPNGASVYTSVYTTVGQYDRALATGLLTAKAPETVAAGSNLGRVVVTPDGQSAYVTSTGNHRVYQFDVDQATGALTAKTPAYVSAGSSPIGIAITPDGQNAYVASNGNSSVYQFDIDQATGALTPMSTPFVSSGSSPTAITVSPDGGSAYVVRYTTSSPAVYQYDINSSTGALTAKTPPSVSLYTNAYDVAMHPDGKSLYTAHLYGSGSSDVSQFDVDESTGVLSAKSPATVYAGSAPFSVTVTPSQAPTAAFTASSPAYTGSSVSFNGSSSSDTDGTVARYDWDFGDTTTLDDGGPTPNHTYNSSGNYDVTLTVTDSDGCSTQLIFTGRTAYCNGGPSATTTTEVAVSDPPPPPVNTALPTISGSPYVGQQLSCSTGTWTNNPTVYSYEWRRGGTPISGAASSTYTLVGSDAGNSITCRVTATNAGGSNSATSSAVEAIGAPANTALPAISGSQVVGQELSCSQGTWTNSPTGYAYQWKRDGSPIFGATSPTYTLIAGDANHQIRCSVTASNAGGSNEATSELVIPIGPPVNTVLPAISGTPYVGQTLTCSNGTWAFPDTIDFFTYQWRRDGSPISGATSSTYTLVEADASTSITCRVTASNEAADVTATSSSVNAIGVPANTVIPSISGTPHVGQQLSCSTGTWTNNPTVYSYEWRRDGSPISGATDSTYDLVEADASTLITCRNTATNLAGSTVATSNSVNAIGVPANSSLPSVSGTSSVGQQLSCTQGTWIKDPTDYTYQWKRDGEEIIFGTGNTYNLVTTDAGHAITCQVTASNAAGSSSVSSSAVNVPTPLAPAQDTTPPVVTIDSGPGNVLKEISTIFTFHANEERVGFECQLNSEGWGPCGSPEVVYGLALGRHTFQVRAQDRAGNTGLPATWTWVVDRKAPRLDRSSIKKGKKRPPAIRLKDLATISGITSDDYADVKKVKLKLKITNAQKKRKKNKCAYLSLKSGKRIKHRCKRAYTKVQGTDKWSLPLPMKVRNRMRSRDRYRLYIRTTDTVGNQKTYGVSFRVKK